MNTEDCNIRVT